MLKRLHIYFKERYPIIQQLIIGIIIFAVTYFIILLNNGITEFSIGIQEFVGIYTVFAFFMWLRIADDLKDCETDKKLFKERPLASGRTKVKDVVIVCAIVQAIAIVLNIIFMNNLIFFIILYIYGYLMSKWFFMKDKIEPSLPLALITHNPVQAILILYVISFTVIKYNIPPFSLINVLTLFTLYLPGLMWEVSRKIRVPKDETKYTTYSKLFGYKKATKFVLIITILNCLTNIILVYNLNIIAVGLLILLLIWIIYKFIQFLKNPTSFKLSDKIERYVYCQEAIVLITVIVYLIVGKI